MDCSFNAPDATIDLLKCTLCEGYLSITPVMSISDDGNQYKCGRCFSVKTPVNIRATIYEQLAKFMTFPCIYKECSKKIPFSDVKDHEKVCEYRTTVCPKSGCTEVVRLKKILEHFKDKHADVCHNNSFSIKNVYAYFNIDIMEKNGKTYLSFFDFDDLNFGVSICAVDYSDTPVQYEVYLKSEKSNYTIHIPNQNVVMFNEREHCFKCIGGNCKARFHLYKDKKKDVGRRMTTKISREGLKKMFGAGQMTYTINIEDEKVDEKSTDNKVEVKDALIRKAKKIFMQMLECPVCKGYMSPPIPQCLTGHSQCSNCKAKTDICSVCNEKFQNTRNYALEELSKKVELPSDNEKKNIKVDGAVKRPAEESEVNGGTPKVQKK